MSYLPFSLAVLATYDSSLHHAQEGQPDSFLPYPASSSDAHALCPLPDLDFLSVLVLYAHISGNEMKCQGRGCNSAVELSLSKHTTVTGINKAQKTKTTTKNPILFITASKKKVTQE